MALVDSLLSAIVRADGDALVLHAGERPYVVAPSGQSELASKPLTLDAMKGMLTELLPEESRDALNQDGAVQHHVTAQEKIGGEGFTVVAAEGGNDIWIEIRRHRKNLDIEEPVPAPIVEAAPEPAPVPEPVPQTLPEMVPEPIAKVVLVEPAEVNAPSHEHVAQQAEETAYLLADQLEQELEEERARDLAAQELLTEQLLAQEREQEAQEDERETETVQQEPEEEVVQAAEREDFVPAEEPAHSEEAVHARVSPPSAVSEPAPAAVAAVSVVAELELAPVAAVVAGTEGGRPAPPRSVTPEPSHEPALEVHTAVVLPLSRNVRTEQAHRVTPQHPAGIDRLLRIAAARGASTLYLSSQSRPSIRVIGEICPIEGEPVLSESEVEEMMLDIIPERNRETVRTHPGTEWICDVPDIGRIRCVTFRDRRGAGGIFTMTPARAISADQLGLSQEVQELCAETDGLLLITGPRASGKSTLIAAVVDLINRSRSDHVITLENQIKFVHDNRLSLVSQREVLGDDAELTNAARAALRENPDVLVIEDLGSPEVFTLALDAAQSGHLVIGALSAHTAAEALDRIIDQTPPERRPKVQLGMAEALRGVVGQVLLRKSLGGRVAAREVLLNTSTVAKLIAEGKTSQLPMAIESGRKHGMVPLNDALASFVRSGVVDKREAYRQASDQPGLLSLLKRQGIDTSFVERLA